MSSNPTRKKVVFIAPRKRKTRIAKQGNGLSFLRAREIVVSVKRFKKAEATIKGYHKIFNGFDRFFLHRKLISNVNTEDVRNFIK